MPLPVSLKRFPESDGFTFVEMLVSLLILGLISGLLILRILPDSATKLRDETQRLEAVLTLASDFSRLSGQSLAWVWLESPDQVRYTFEVQNRDGRWVPFASKSSLAESLGEHTLPTFLTLSTLEIANEKVPLNEALNREARLIFRPSGINALFRLSLAVRDQPDQTTTLQSDPLGRVFNPQSETTAKPSSLL